MQNLAAKARTPRLVPITVKMYHLMAQCGAFHPDDRIELVGGKIFEMPRIGSLHSRCVRFLNSFLWAKVRDELIVSVHNPIILDDESEPQPDITLLRRADDFYKDALPTASDVKLLIEVADTSIEVDRGVKFSRYAAAGIPEAWLVDLINDRVEVHYAPKDEAYSRSKTFQRGENAVSETIPSIEIPVDDVLG